MPGLKVVPAFGRRGAAVRRFGGAGAVPVLLAAACAGIEGEVGGGIRFDEVTLDLTDTGRKSLRDGRLCDGRTENPSG